MATTTKVLRLKFRCTDESTATISVPDCKSDLTEAAVKGAMNLIIEKNVFSYGGVDLAAPAGAAIVLTESTDVF